MATTTTVAVVGDDALKEKRPKKKHEGTKEKDGKDEKTPRQYDKWKSNENEAFFSALKELGESPTLEFGVIAERVKTKTKEQARFNYHRLVKKIDGMLRPHGCAIEKSDAVRALLCYWHLTSKVNQLFEKAGKASKRLPEKEFAACLFDLVSKGKTKTRRIGGRIQTIVMPKKRTEGGEQAPPEESDGDAMDTTNAVPDPPAVTAAPAPSAAFAPPTAAEKTPVIDAEWVQRNLTPDQLESLRDQLMRTTSPVKPTSPAAEKDKDNKGDKGPRLVVQLLPRDRAFARELSSRNFNPNLRMKLKSSKSVASIIQFLAQKWTGQHNGRVVVAPHPIRLYPPSAAAGTHAGWGLEDKKAAGELFSEMSSPDPFVLHYAWPLEATASAFPTPIAPASFAPTFGSASFVPTPSPASSFPYVAPAPFPHVPTLATHLPPAPHTTCPAPYPPAASFPCLPTLPSHPTPMDASLPAPSVSNGAFPLADGSMLSLAEIDAFAGSAVLWGDSLDLGLDQPVLDHHHPPIDQPLDNLGVDVADYALPLPSGASRQGLMADDESCDRFYDKYRDSSALGSSQRGRPGRVTPLTMRDLISNDARSSRPPTPPDATPADQHSDGVFPNENAPFAGSYAEPAVFGAQQAAHTSHMARARPQPLSTVAPGPAAHRSAPTTPTFSSAFLASAPANAFAPPANPSAQIFTPPVRRRSDVPILPPPLQRADTPRGGIAHMPAFGGATVLRNDPSIFPLKHNSPTNPLPRATTACDPSCNTATTFRQPLGPVSGNAADAPPRRRVTPQMISPGSASARVVGGAMPVSSPPGRTALEVSPSPAQGGTKRPADASDDTPAAKRARIAAWDGGDSTHYPPVLSAILSPQSPFAAPATQTTSPPSAAAASGKRSRSSKTKQPKQPKEPKAPRAKAPRKTSSSKGGRTRKGAEEASHAVPLRRSKAAALVEHAADPAGGFEEEVVEMGSFADRLLTVSNIDISLDAALDVELYEHNGDIGAFLR